MKSIIFFITLLMGLCKTGYTSTYYVSNSGNDSNSGLSLAQAFLSLQHAADIVVAGDSVWVEDGNYAGFDIRNKNGTLTNPIVFKSLSNNAFINSSGPIRQDGINIENADHIIIDGFSVSGMTGNGNGIRVVLSDFCIIRNNNCDNNAERAIFTGFTDDILIENNVCTNSIDEHGIYVSNSSDRPVIRYNECYGNNNIGIHLNGDLSAGGDGIISDAQIYGNIIHDNNLAAGINMDGVLNARIYNNLIYNNHSAQGIALFQQDGAVMTSGAKIYNNTIIVPSDGRWGILLKSGADANTEIYNNIILNFHAWRGCIAAESASLLTSDYNILHDKMSDAGDGSVESLADWQLLGLDQNSVIAGSLTTIFSNAATNDYHLFNGSQAVNIGTWAVASLVNVDLDFVPRPVGDEYDIGAYEYLGAVAISFDQPFSIEQIESSVKMSWSSADETMLRNYVIERSVRGSNWNHLASILSNSKPSKYIYFDDDPPQSTLYYRLKTVDQTGAIEYSPVEFIDLTEKNSILIYPNPSDTELLISKLKGINKLRIYNLQGQLLIQQIFHDSQRIDVSHLSPGQYILSVENKGKILNKLLFIN
jgi:parallel beta-helix repeat protein